MVEINNDRERIVLGGLLHDIGKMLNRCSPFMNENKILERIHPRLSLWFVKYLEKNRIIKEDKYLEEIVLKHHESSAVPEELYVSKIKDKRLRILATIVSNADNYSSSERNGEETRRVFKSVPLDCIFSSVSLDKKGNNTEKNRYHIAPLTTNNIFPTVFQENTELELQVHIEKFLKEVLEIKTDDFKTLYLSLREIIKKYCWCIPSDTQKDICDLSLFDHLSTTSAIALATYNYVKEIQEDISELKYVEVNRAKTEDYYLLIAGDISGIQSYIFDIKSTEGAAKRIRFRSFFIKLLTDIIAYKFIEELDLEMGNIIISSSGKFYILAPNTENVKEKLQNLIKEVNSSLYKEYLGKIFFNCASLSLTGNDLGLKFAKKYSDINNLLNKNKMSKFNKEVFENIILEEERIVGEVQQCKICGNRLSLKNEDCEYCNRDFKLGEKLPKVKKIAFYKEEDKIEEDILLFGIKCKFYTDSSIEGKPFLITYYGDNESKDNFPSIQDYYGGLTPINNQDSVMSFEEIANLSASKNLGLLKGDVDNLGLTINYGLKITEIDDAENKINDITSISRVSTMSRMLDTFFSFWLKEKLKKDNMYYIVYAGGDDFMILGPWDKLVNTANDIRQYFEEFVGNNENITLTSAITLLRAKEPIYYGTKQVQEAEKFGKISGKNGLVLFNKYIPWNKFYEIKRLIDFLDDNMNKGIFSQAFIYRLLKYTMMAEKYEETKDGKYLKYISDFTYDISRNLIDRKIVASTSEEIKMLNRYFGIESLVSDDRKNFIGKYMRVILNYVVRKNRGGSKNAI